LALGVWKWCAEKIVQPKKEIVTDVQRKLQYIYWFTFSYEL